MKKLNHFLVVPLMISLVSAVSCVNEDYDLNKIEVGDVAVFKGAILPIGDTKTFRLKDLIPIDDSDPNQILFCDSDGNYVLKLEEHNLEHSFKVPSFKFDGYWKDHPNQVASKYPIIVPDISKLTPGESLPEKTDAIPIDNFVFDIEIDQSNLPEELLSIRHVDVTTNVLIKFEYDQNKLPFNKIMVTKGAKIDFPDWIVLGNTPAGFKKDGNALISTEEIAIFPTLKTQISIPLDELDMSKLPEGQGFKDGKLFVDDVVTLSGNVFVYTADCTGYGEYYPIITSYLHMDEMTIQSVEAKVDVSKAATFEDQEIEIGAIPDVFEDENLVLDLAGIRMNLGVQSSFPIAGQLSADVSTHVASQSEPLWFSSLGPIDIPAGTTDNFSKALYSFSEAGTGAPAGYKDVAVSGLDSILKQLPEKFMISNTSVNANDYGVIVPDTEYKVSLDYGLVAPLSFRKGLRFVYTQDFEDLNISISRVESASVKLKFKVVSTLPISFDLSAKALDENGEEKKDLTAVLDAKIAAGTIENPTVSPIVVTLSNKGKIEFDGLRLSFEASAGFDKATLNENQSLQIIDLCLLLPDGVNMTFDTYEN